MLPPLFFGHMRSKIDLDLLEMQGRVNAITNWVGTYDVLGSPDYFQHRTAVFAGDSVRLI